MVVDYNEFTFIVIARNEEFFLTRVLQSIAALTSGTTQIVCVDSNSSDRTAEIMESFSCCFNGLRIIKMNTEGNAAAARNVGLNNVETKYVFFVDGDTEIHSDFVEPAVNLLSSALVGSVAGRLAEVQYDSQKSNILRIIDDRFEISTVDCSCSTGGTFLTRCDVVKAVGFFDANFFYNEDRDYLLRIRRHYLTVVMPILMGTHHTIAYQNRPYNLFYNLPYYFLGKCVYKNCKSLPQIVAVLIAERGLQIGFLSLLLIVLFFFTGSKYLFALFAALIVFDLLYGFIKNKEYFYRLHTHYIAPVSFLCGYCSGLFGR